MSKKIKYLTLLGSVGLATGVGAQVYLCQQCNPGTYAGYGATSCTPCQAGTFTNVSGSTSCTPCSAGSFSKSGATSCTQCSAGTVSASRANMCTSCTPGWYQDEAGKSSCKQCGAGTRSNHVNGSTGCIQCPANTYAPAGSSSCTACGYWETSSAGSTSCTGLKYEIESTVDYVYAGFGSKSGTLSPGFYLIRLYGGNGGTSEVPLPNVTPYGKGAKLKYMIKVTSDTPYTIAAGENGTSTYYSYGDSSDSDGWDGYSANATGGGGGSWAKIGDTYYIAGGGGGVSYAELPTSGHYNVTASGGNGGSAGSGGSGGNQWNYNGEDDDYLGGTKGGSSPKAPNPSNGYEGSASSASCPTFQSSPYGGTGSAISKIPCPGFNRMFCHTWTDGGESSSDTYSTKEISNASQCSGGDNHWVLYYKDAENGKVSHSDNTGGRFDNLKPIDNVFWSVGVEIYKIK